VIALGHVSIASAVDGDIGVHAPPFRLAYIFDLALRMLEVTE
jgi:hypothetical protein